MVETFGELEERLLKRGWEVISASKIDASLKLGKKAIYVLDPKEWYLGYDSPLDELECWYSERGFRPGYMRKIPCRELAKMLGVE